MEAISVQELAGMLKRPNPPRLVDVRERDEWQIAHIEGSELIPMSGFAENWKLLSPDEEIVVFCHHGGRSRKVQEFLCSKGFRNVINLSGGIDAWSVHVDSSVPRY